MRRFLKLLLLIEAVIIIASCSCAAYSITSLYSKPEFLLNYRAVCTTCFTASILFLLTLVSQERLFKENLTNIRYIRISGGIFVVIVAFAVCSWIFDVNPVQEHIQTSAYRNLVVWLGLLPIFLAAAIFFKPPKVVDMPTEEPKT